MSKGYYTLTRITDYGPFITKVILPVGETIKASKSLAKAFTVFAERLDDNGEVLKLPKSWMAIDDKEPSQGYLSVRKAYPSTKEGEEDSKGTFLTLEIAYGPQYTLAAPMTSVNGMNAYVHHHLVITQTQPVKSGKTTITGLTFDYCLGNTCPDTKGWQNRVITDDDKEGIGYGYYIPQVKAEGKRPLIIWLHGAGEGGYDPTVAYTGNKVTAFAQEKVQSYFGGAYVLAPQTPTFWMNDGSGMYHDESKTIYGKKLKECIDNFIAMNPQIDTNRIYIGGDSNGGFMTVRMIIDYPTFFAAAFPTCEAFYDKNITDEMIESIRDMGIWFIHAKNDPVVNPKETVVPTYERLIKAGAKNTHFTYWDKIEDIAGAFEPVNGKPFEYLGHFAWIHVYNDACQADFDGKPAKVGKKKVGLLEWLSLQSK